MKILLFLAFSLTIAAQPSLPPASVADLQEAALVRFRVPAELPEDPLPGVSSNLLRIPSYGETFAERNGKKIPNLEKRDTRLMVGPRGLFAAFVTITFHRKYTMELRHKR